MTRLRALGIAWLASALISIVITFVFRTAPDGYVVTLVLGVATVALGAWLLLRPSGRARGDVGRPTGVAWLAGYGPLAVLQGDEARVTDTFLAFAGTAFGVAAWMMLGKRTPVGEPGIVVASAAPAAPGTGWLRLAATLYVFLGLAFGAWVPFVLAFYTDNGYLPMMFSFRALSGPVESWGELGSWQPASHSSRPQRSPWWPGCCSGADSGAVFGWAFCRPRCGRSWPRGRAAARPDRRPCAGGTGRCGHVAGSARGPK